MSDYRINPPYNPRDHAPADGIVENNQGAWLGEVTVELYEDGEQETIVMPYTDDGGDYLPAPTGWKKRIIEKL